MLLLKDFQVSLYILLKRDSDFVVEAAGINFLTAVL